MFISTFFFLPLVFLSLHWFDFVLRSMPNTSSSVENIQRWKYENIEKGQILKNKVTEKVIYSSFATSSNRLDLSAFSFHIISMTNAVCILLIVDGFWCLIVLYRMRKTWNSAFTYSWHRSSCSRNTQWNAKNIEQNDDHHQSVKLCDNVAVIDIEIHCAGQMIPIFE